MTRLAFGLKCGCLGARELTPAIFPAAETLPCPRSDPRAMAPKPTPHSLKNQRRVICWRYWLKKCSCLVMASFFGDGFVQVQQHARDNSICGQLRGSRAGREVRGRFVFTSGDVVRVLPAVEIG